MNRSPDPLENPGPSPVPAPEEGPAIPVPQMGADGLPRLPADSIPVVGIGGSAGSLEPLQKFLAKLPEKTGAAYVIATHLAPEHKSLLAAILQKETKLPVEQVTGDVKLQPDQVWVIPPGKQLSMTDGILSVRDLPRQKGRHVTVDLFFRALAETHGADATAIVLSGGDSDGSIGIRRIKERGGLTIAQDPSEAEQTGMPRAAIATGMVDWILPADEMPQRLLEYWENGRKLQLPDVELPGSDSLKEAVDEGNEAVLRKILGYLKARTGHDFEYYKRATVLRRIGRRMQVNGCSGINDYLIYLREHPGETGALLQDLLISVTNFFRDKEAFAALEAIMPEIFRDKGAGEQVRVWVPACATGEEAYSIAMLLAEHAAKLTHPPGLQIFATDLDQSAIDVARDGTYPETIVADVSEERLRRFFVMKQDGGYTVRRELREMILFARHDLLRDSPFSRLDLVTCRNLLIYLGREAQARIFDIFHFALGPGGYLFLGSSESAEEASGLFAQVDKKHRIYTRRTAPRMALPIPTGPSTLAFEFRGPRRAAPAGVAKVIPALDEGLGLPASLETANSAELHLALIEHLAPPSVVVNLNHDIVHLSRTAGKYLRLGGGEPTVNLLNLVHPELKTELRAALFRVSKSQSPVRVPGLTVTLAGNEKKSVTLSVETLGEVSRDFFIVIFDDRDTAHANGGDEKDAPDPGIVRHLEEELDQLRATWRDTAEQYEASTEELKASNEELQAINEELRSATEELETGREELQSINEETITINQELKGKVEELGRANGDLQNLMAATRIPTIFLDRDLHIKRFTPSTADLFNFIPSDVGRPLSDLTHSLEYPAITADAEKVVEDLAAVEREVCTTDGRWFLVRLSPYRTTEDQIAGVVITFVDISERKKNEDSRRWLSAIVECSGDAIISFDMDGRILSWNHGAEQMFGYAAGEIIGRSHGALAPAGLQDEKRRILEMLRRGENLPPFETVGLCKGGDLIDVSLSASVMKNEAGEIVAATAIARDISFQKRAVEDLKHARDELETRVEERTAELQRRIAQLAQMASEVTLAEQRERKRMAHILHDELQQVLVSVKMRIEALANLDDGQRPGELESLSALMEEVIDSSRSLAVDLSPPVLSEGLGPSLKWLAETWMKDRYHLTVHARIDPSIDTGRDDLRSVVFRAVRELLFNVVKHAHVGEAHLELVDLDGKNLRVTVRDQGVGFDGNIHASGKCPTGLGLTGLDERLGMLGGSLRIHSHPGEGTEAVIIAPMKPAGATK